MHRGSGEVRAPEHVVRNELFGSAIEKNVFGSIDLRYGILHPSRLNLGYKRSNDWPAVSFLGTVGAGAWSIIVMGVGG
jgi:hypothetical protein